MGACRSDAPSFSTSILCRIEIGEKKDKGALRPTLTVERTVVRKVLRDLEWGEGSFSFYESGHAPAKELRMTLNGKKVSGDNRVSKLVIGRDDYLSERKVHTFLYSDLPRKGDIVEYHVSYNYIDIAYCPLFYVENAPDDSMESFRLEANSPSGWSVVPEIFDIAASEYSAVEQSNPSQLTISFGPRPRRDYRENFAFNAFHAIVALDIRKGDSVLTLSDPVKMLVWYQSKIDLHPVLEASTVTPFLDSIGSLGDALSQLRGVHDWVRTHIRYLADDTRNHSILPHDPDSVLTTGFGDCKDRAYLICALAQRLNLAVHLGVVSTTPSPPFVRMTPWQFNHVICAYSDSSGTTLFDPTAKYSEFDAQPDEIVDKPALILDPDRPRFELVSRIDTLPSVDFSLRVHVDSLNAGELRVVLRREYLARLRYVLAEQTLEGWEKIMLKSLSAYLPNSSLSLPTLVDTQSNQAVLRFAMDVSRLVARSSKAWYLPGTMLSLLRETDFSERNSDSLGFYIDELTYARLRCKIVGAKLRAEVSPLDLSNDDIGKVSTVVQSDGSGIVCDFSVRLFHTMYEGENRRRLNDFVSQYNLARKQLIQIERGTI